MAPAAKPPAQKRKNDKEKESAAGEAPVPIKVQKTEQASPQAAATLVPREPIMPSKGTDDCMLMMRALIPWDLLVVPVQ